MGPELVWNAVLQWPAAALAALVVAGVLLRRAVDPARVSVLVRIASRFAPFLAVLLPVTVSIAVQESMPTLAVLAPAPGGISFTALPRAMLASAAVACVLDVGAGLLGRAVVAVTVPVVALVFLSPPGLGGGGPQLLAVAIAAVVGFACAGTARHRSTGFLVGWCVLLSVASAMVLLSGFAKLAVVLGATSAMSAALAISSATVTLPIAGDGLATALCTALVACAFLGAGYDESGFPRWTWVLLAASPGAAAVTATILPPAEGSALVRRLRAVATCLAPAAMAAVALGCAVALAPSDAASPGVP